jgi:hypothetical protein
MMQALPKPFAQPMEWIMSHVNAPTDVTESLPPKLAHTFVTGFLSNEKDVARMCKAALQASNRSLPPRLLRWVTGEEALPRIDRQRKLIAKVTAEPCCEEVRFEAKKMMRALFACAGSADTSLRDAAIVLLGRLTADDFRDQLVKEALKSSVPGKCERLLVALASTDRPLSWQAQSDVQLIAKVSTGRARAAAVALLAVDERLRDDEYGTPCEPEPTQSDLTQRWQDLIWAAEDLLSEYPDCIAHIMPDQDEGLRKVQDLAKRIKEADDCDPLAP